MCSLNWFRFNDHIGIAFNRDESVLREKSEYPRIYSDNGVRYIMPKDPKGGGSWLAVNEYGLAVLLLNDYQGQLKPQSPQLISRGLLVREIAACKTLEQANEVARRVELSLSQPFQLCLLQGENSCFWHYDGRVTSLADKTLPQHIFSSGHKDALDIIAKRHAFMATHEVESEDQLIALHRSHEPNVSGLLRYAFCMHRDDACSQSLTYIRLESEKVTLKYWHGQPCQSTDLTELSLPLVSTL